MQARNNTQIIPKIYNNRHKIIDLICNIHHSFQLDLFHQPNYKNESEPSLYLKNICLKSKVISQILMDKWPL